MKILGLLQDFNSQQEAQNKSLKEKMIDLQAEVEKRFKLFTAYQSQDNLNEKVESLFNQIGKFEETL